MWPWCPSGSPAPRLSLLRSLLPHLGQGDVMELARWCHQLFGKFSEFQLRDTANHGHGTLNYFIKSESCYLDSGSQSEIIPDKSSSSASSSPTDHTREQRWPGPLTITTNSGCQNFSFWGNGALMGLGVEPPKRGNCSVSGFKATEKLRCPGAEPAQKVVLQDLNLHHCPSVGSKCY